MHYLLILALVIVVGVLIIVVCAKSCGKGGVGTVQTAAQVVGLGSADDLKSEAENIAQKPSTSAKKPTATVGQTVNKPATSQQQKPLEEKLNTPVNSETQSPANLLDGKNKLSDETPSPANLTDGKNQPSDQV